jgi:cyclopropane fatty-acyl-phospholipid synthase-like methyltransferase
VDYDRFAATYAWSRSTLPWVLTPLARLAAGLPPGAAVLEIGCGTGNYLRLTLGRGGPYVAAGEAFRRAASGVRGLLQQHDPQHPAEDRRLVVRDAQAADRFDRPVEVEHESGEVPVREAV